MVSLKITSSKDDDDEKSQGDIITSRKLEAAAELPKVNAKQEAHATKVKLHTIPPRAITEMARAFNNGATKYGAFNWRESTSDYTVYYNAMIRHALEWQSGVDKDDDGVPHLAAIMANCAILLDMQDSHLINDDRNKKHPLRT